MSKGNSKKAEQYTDAVMALSEIHQIIEKFYSSHPDVDLATYLSEHDKLQPVIEHFRSNELSRFISYAKEQGTNMSFSDMEMGVLAAGRKDMQDGLSEIADSLKFDAPICSECDEKKDNRGRSKKN